MTYNDAKPRVQGVVLVKSLTLLSAPLSSWQYAAAAVCSTFVRTVEHAARLHLSAKIVPSGFHLPNPSRVFNACNMYGLHKSVVHFLFSYTNPGCSVKKEEKSKTANHGRPMLTCSDAHLTQQDLHGNFYCLGALIWLTNSIVAGLAWRSNVHGRILTKSNWRWAAPKAQVESERADIWGWSEGEPLRSFGSVLPELYDQYGGAVCSAMFKAHVTAFFL